MIGKLHASILKTRNTIQVTLYWYHSHHITQLYLLHITLTSEDAVKWALFEKSQSNITEVFRKLKVLLYSISMSL